MCTILTMGKKINVPGSVMAAVSVWWLVVVSGSSGTFISGEEAIGSPLRVAQCRAQCLQTVSRNRAQTIAVREACCVPRSCVIVTLCLQDISEANKWVWVAIGSWYWAMNLYYSCRSQVPAFRYSLSVNLYGLV
jgi:hypothetical protein